MIKTLYHGSQTAEVEPKFGLGSDFHDYGAGFYLTDRAELAAEWAVYRPNSLDGWIHAFELDLDGLKVFDFREAGVLPWIAELMKHRAADESSAYRRRAPIFISRYGIDLSSYDVVVGWRADASYFYIAKAFVRDEIDVSALDGLLKLGGFGIQYTVKSERAYRQLKSLPDQRLPVVFSEKHADYVRRDSAARDKMRELIADPGFNKLERLFSDIIREETRV